MQARFVQSARRVALVFSSVATCACAVQPSVPPAVSGDSPPLTIERLRQTRFESELVYERPIDAEPGFSAYLVSYRSSGLEVYAMVAVPDTPPPAPGYPVLIANHGFHPTPERYGITAEGRRWRPGDYYRAIPRLYAQAGFLVVVPDYRGHNESEGYEFTEGFLASSYYTIDVLTLLAGIDGLEHADTRNLFMWGHSLGGEVTLRALLATDRIRAATLWAPVSGDYFDQAYHYSRFKDPTEPDDSETVKDEVAGLREHIARLGHDYDTAGSDPLNYLDYLSTPLVIHHSLGDGSVPYRWSELLAGRLYRQGLPYRFFSYAGDAHLFSGDDRDDAVARDVAFFRSVMQSDSSAAD